MVLSPGDKGSGRSSFTLLCNYWISCHSSDHLGFFVTVLVLEKITSARKRRDTVNVRTCNRFEWRRKPGANDNVILKYCNMEHKIIGRYYFIVKYNNKKKRKVSVRGASCSGSLCIATFTQLFQQICRSPKQQDVRWAPYLYSLYKLNFV